MNIASKIIIGYVSYNSLKNVKKKEYKQNIENYTSTIDEVMTKYNKDIIKNDKKKYKADNILVNRKIKTKEECKQIFNKFIKKNNLQNETINKLFTYTINTQRTILNKMNNFLSYNLFIKKKSYYKLMLEFEIEDINHINIFLSDNKEYINIPFENTFIHNKVKIIIHNFTNIENLHFYILFKDLYKSTPVNNVRFYLQELKDNNEMPMLIYKNNDFIKQIFYEQKNIFTLHNYLIRTPCH
tara:strand:+ start:106 stop:828 length:723 start_codon:yes stop_codon:yes gene_type:complete